MKTTKLLALLLALSMIALLGGCSGENTRTAASYSGGEIPAGVYLYYQLAAYTEAFYTTYSTDLETEIEGVPMADWINDSAQKQVKIFAAVEAECASRGIALDAAAEDSVRASTESFWESGSEAMTVNGVSYDSVLAVMMNHQKQQLLFDTLYGEGGEREVSEQELQDYFVENYRRILSLIIPKYDEAGLYTGEELAELEAKIDGYAERLENGEALLDVLTEYNSEQGITISGAAEVNLESLVSKNDTYYPADFLEQLFASDELNTLETYDSSEVAIFYERRDPMGDETSFETLKDSLRSGAVGETFSDELAAQADSIGFSFNEAAVKRYQPKNLNF